MPSPKTARPRREKFFAELRAIKGSAWTFSGTEKKKLGRGWRYVGWAARRSVVLPAHRSPADHAFANLLTLSEFPRHISVATGSSFLGRLAGEPVARQFEFSLDKKQWAWLAKTVEPSEFVKFVRARLGEWEIWPRALQALLNSEFPSGGRIEIAEPELGELWSELAIRFPARANPEHDWSSYRELFPALVAAAQARPDSHRPWRVWLNRWWSSWADKLQKQPSAFGDLAAVVLEQEEFEAILTSASMGSLLSLRQWSLPSYLRVQACSPIKLAKRIELFWESRSFEESMWKWRTKGSDNLAQLLDGLATVALEHLSLHLGVAIGLELRHRGAESEETATRILHEFALPPLASLPPSLRFQVHLWRDLQLLSEYQHESYRRETELIGMRSSLMAMASDNPGGWARALPWILECLQHLGGLAEAVTVAIVEGSPEVAAELDRLVAAGESDLVRNRARGIQRLSEGYLDPRERLAQDLLSFSARHLDSSALIPQPLGAPSSTWLGEHGIETLLRATSAEAESRFRQYFASQGGIEEEAVTSRLLAELEHAFAAAQSRVEAIATRSSRTPSLRLSYRQVPKREEHEYGCDLAILVTISGERSGVEVAELVQVKKPLRTRRGEGFSDRWRIPSRQLLDILGYSSTATYWLLGVRGEVLVLPAKLLRALKPRQRFSAAGPESDYEINYLQVRSAAIPLSQFLVDLLVGLWLGTVREETVRFAKGEAQATFPRFIVEVTVDWGGERRA